MAATLGKPYRRRYPLKTSSSLGAPTAGDIELELRHFLHDNRVAPERSPAKSASTTTVANRPRTLSSASAAARADPDDDDESILSVSAVLKDSVCLKHIDYLVVAD